MSEEQNGAKEEGAEKTVSGPTIKIAPSSGRQQEGAADPGPGDLEAAPSEAPQLVELPPPPKSSSTGPPSATSGKLATQSSRMPSSSAPRTAPASKAAASSAAAPASSRASGASSARAGLSNKMVTTAGSTAAPKSSAVSKAKTSSNTSPTSSTGAEQTGEQSPSEGPSASASPSPSPSPETSEPAGSEPPTTADTGKIVKGKKGKKVKKFRYHKRVSVQTKGKTNPATVMDKVNEKDHRAGITVDKLDPQELMRRAGIDGKPGTHWRIRLRQTKRTKGKDGKMVTETRVAYRDSEGHSAVKTIEGEACKKCLKKMEECECDHK